MSKALIFSDFHLHNWSYGSTYENGWNSRLLDQKNVCDQLIAAANSHNVDYVIFCGDLFHTHGKIEAGPMSVAAHLFSSLNINNRKIVILVGNHDLGREVNSVDWLSKLGPNIRVVADTYVDDVERFGFAAYTDSAEVLKDRLEVLKDCQYWFLHQGVSGVPVGSDFVIPSEIFNTDMVPETVNNVFTGHYHAHRATSTGTVVIGSPMQFTWGDRDSIRGFIILNTADDVRDLERAWAARGGALGRAWFHVRLIAPRFVVLTDVLSISQSTHMIDTPEAFRGGNRGLLERARAGGVVMHSVKDNYVRVTGETPTVFMDDLRKLIVDQAGARTLEFSYKSPRAVIGNVAGLFELEDIIQSYIKNNNVSDDGIKVLEEIRSAVAKS